MTDISNNAQINETPASFLLRYLTSNINPDSAPNNIREAITNIINELEPDISNPILPINRTRRSRRSGPNALFNHTIPSTNPINDLDNDYSDFISQLFTPPTPYTSRRRNINSILQQSLMDPSQDIYKKVLTKEGEKDIKTVVFKTDNFPNDSCPMTLNDFSSGDKVSQLPCGHIFDTDAIIKWLKKENASCPVCREPLQSKEIKKNLLSTIRDSSFNRLTPSRIITRPPRNTILSLMGRRIQREEEEELQVAIMESLRMSTNNTNDSNND
jgi:hypothetical protein